MSSLPQAARPIACIVLPTYNERNNLRVVLPLIFEQAERITTHNLHVLVVDDNSPDGTADLVREAMPGNPNLHLLTGEKRGIGDAYKRGMSYAVENLGASSVRYRLAVFKAGAAVAAASGGYTHVYVERASGRPTPIPEGHRRLMRGLAKTRETP